MAPAALPEDERADEEDGGGTIPAEAAVAVATADPAAAAASASVEERSEWGEWATWILRGGQPVRSRKRGVKSVREEVPCLLLVLDGE